MADDGQRRRAPRSAAARTRRPACRTTRAGTCTSTSAARAAPARASTSSASSIADPTDATFLRRAAHGRAAVCHDNNVLSTSAACKSATRCAPAATASRVQVRHGRACDRRHAASPGGVENPTLLYSKPMGVTTGHSGSFTYDGKLLIFGHEPGGGTQAPVPGDRARIAQPVAVLPRPGDGQPDRLACAAAAADEHARTARGTTSTSCRRTRATTASRQLPDGHLGARLHRTRRPPQRSPSPIRRRSYSRRASHRSAAVTGRPTGTTAASTSPTSAAA